MEWSSKEYETDAVLFADFRHLVLQDPEHPDLAPGDFTGDPERVGSVGIGMIALFCIGQVPEPRAHVEVWSGTPPDHLIDGSRFEGTIETLHSRLFLGAPTGSPLDIEIPLRSAGCYRVRAVRVAAERYPAPDYPNVIVEREDWTIHIWPDDQVSHDLR